LKKGGELSSLVFIFRKKLTKLNMKKIIFLLIPLNIAFAQRNFIGVSYNWEIFQYNAITNQEFFNKIGESPSTSFEINQWEIFYFSKVKNFLSIYISIGVGGAREKGFLKTSSNALTSMAVGIGARWFEIYAGAKARAFIELKQKSINIKNQETWDSFKDSDLLFSYCAFQGLKFFLGDHFNIYAEIEENFYPFKLVENKTENLTPAFKQLTFLPFSLRFGIGLLFELK